MRFSNLSTMRSALLLSILILPKVNKNSQTPSTMQKTIENSLIYALKKETQLMMFHLQTSNLNRKLIVMVMSQQMELPVIKSKMR